MTEIPKSRIKDVITAAEFQQMHRNGIFVTKGKRIKTQELLPEYENHLENKKVKNATNCVLNLMLNEYIKIDIKPLSVNEAFKGRRFHTKEHKIWSKTVLGLLPNIVMPEPPYEIYLKFGFSSVASDWDNCIKQVQDCLADKYQFNDKLIRRGVVETEIVNKGKEYFIFSIKHLIIK